MMKLDKNLIDLQGIAQDICEHLVFRSFDVHFQKRDALMTVVAHER